MLKQWLCRIMGGHYWQGQETISDWCNLIVCHKCGKVCIEKR
jgi:hypothetical protein